MAKADTDQPVQVPLLDRLVDLDPKNREEAQITRAQSVRLLKAALRRDLEWLLNTRAIPELAPEGFPELRRSLYSYGLFDITSISRDSQEEHQRLARLVEDAITLFEPRLANVHVALVPSAEEDLRRIRFLIQGMLRMDPIPEQISFDTVLEVGSSQYEIKGD